MSYDNMNPNSEAINPNLMEEQAKTKNNTLTYEIEGQEYLVDLEFRDMFPPTTTERYEELKEAIRNEGVRDDLIVWDETDILLDGHTRLKICIELNIKPPVRRMPFVNREAAERWVLQNQFIRRNIPTFKRIEIALRYKDCIAAKAKANQRAAGGAVPQTCGKAVDTNKELGKLAGTNAEMVRKVKTILIRATPAEIKALRQDDVKINTVFKKYDDKDKKQACQPSPVSGKQPEPNPEPAPPTSSAPEPKPEPEDKTSGEIVPESILPLESDEEQSRNLEEQIAEHIALLDEFVAGRSLSEERVLIRERIREWANSKPEGIVQPFE